MTITIYCEEDGTIVGMSTARADAIPIEVVPQDDDSSREGCGVIGSIRIEAPAGASFHLHGPERQDEMFDNLVRNYRVERGKLVKR